MKKMLLVMALAVSMVGCNAYGTAAKLAQDIAVSVNQADSTIDSFRVSGTISSDEERNILGYLGSLNTFNGVYIGCVQAAHTAGSKVGSFTACANSLLSSTGNPATIAALHINNQQKQQEVTAVAQGIVTLVETTITALGGK